MLLDVLARSFKLSASTPLPAVADLPSALQDPDPVLSAALCDAAAARISISVINMHAIGLLSRLLCSHPSSIICSIFIWPSSCSAHASNTSPDGSPPQLPNVMTLSERYVVNFAKVRTPQKTPQVVVF